MSGDFKPAEFCVAPVTDDHAGHPFVEEPIHSRKYNQAQTEGQRHEHNSNQHNQASPSLIKIFLDVKLRALTNQTLF